VQAGRVKDSQTHSRVGGKAASGYALRSFAANAVKSKESGQSICFKTGQFYLLLTVSAFGGWIQCAFLKISSLFLSSVLAWIVLLVVVYPKKWPSESLTHF
jgi:hypothetical protein